MRGTVVFHLHSLDMLPAIVFCYSRRTCELIARALLAISSSVGDDCTNAVSVAFASLDDAVYASIATLVPAHEEPALEHTKAVSQASATPSRLPSCGDEPRMLLISPREVNYGARTLASSDKWSACCEVQTGLCLSRLLSSSSSMGTLGHRSSRACVCACVRVCLCVRICVCAQDSRPRPLSKYFRGR